LGKWEDEQGVTGEMIRHLNYNNFSETIDENRVSVIKFWHAQCPLCVSLKPIYQRIAHFYKDDFDFYESDTSADERRLADWLREEPEKGGVPEIFLYHQGKFKEIPWPKNPSPSGYSEQLLFNFLEFYNWYRSMYEERSEL
jgi:thiol-disulfide isomerase/thioredoxin